MDARIGDRALVVGEGCLGLARVEGPAVGGPAVRDPAVASPGGTPRLSVVLLCAASTAKPTIERLSLTREAAPVASAVEFQAAFTPVLAPFDFGAFAYDPASELEATLTLAYEDGRGPSYAAWALAEPALFRFAFDQSIAEALDEAKGSPEWYRFAGLNELYRAMVKAVLPFGLVPPGWVAGLRGGRGADAGPERARGGFLERVLARPPARVLPRLARLPLVEARLEPVRIETPAARADTARRGTRTRC